tara:strand:- start:990 stop:1655 length:666 start_codon:yes stop_codon:yes gene_type:complete
MSKNPTSNNSELISQEEPELSGIYGRYRITAQDKKEVKLYRFSILLCAIAFCSGLIHWLLLGPASAWIWLFPMSIGLGLALKWIHIYLRPLHKALQIFWGVGCLGASIALFKLGPEHVLNNFSLNPISSITICPLFAALTGLGFKEFFCFRRPEAIGLTIFIPIALLGHLGNVLNGEIVMSLLTISAFLLLILSLRKFGIDASADIGDKSVFEYLQSSQTT